MHSYTISLKSIFSTLHPYILGVFTAALINIAIVALCSFMFSVSKTFSPEAVLGVVIGADVICAFVGGYIAARIKKEKGIVCGAIVGGILFILVLTGGMISGFEEITYRTILSFGILLIFGALGGIKGVNRKTRIKIK